MSAFGIESGGWFGEADRDERAGDRAAADAGAGKRKVDQPAAGGSGVGAIGSAGAQARAPL